MNEKQGFIPVAQYSDPGLPEYGCNPLISALPSILSWAEAVEHLQCTPHFDSQEVMLDGRLRVHAIARLLHSFFQPFSHHLELESKISLMIRQGYIGRNPASGAFYSHLQNGFRRVEKEDLDVIIFSDATSTASSLSLFGCSGCGKTRTLERIFSQYPQVLHHSDSNITQIIYLKIDCPIDGDLDELCLSFFNEVDRILHTSYSRSHGRKKLGTKRLLASMCQIANLHALGVLIIDEVQNLNEARSGGAEKMHNFFVSLVNTIGVPVIQVGTHRARKFFQRTFRAARRITGVGSMQWDRLRRDQHWKLFLEKLWGYQWLRNAEPLTEELEELMYELTQGVMDIVIKLFTLSQVRAIATGSECIKPKLLKKVFDDEFKPVQPMLSALRSGRPELIAKYDDLLMPEIEVSMLTLAGALSPMMSPTPSRVKPSNDKAKHMLSLLEQMEVPKDIALPMINELLAENSDLPIAALIHQVTAYMARQPLKEVPKTVSRIKQTQWSQLPPEDLRHIYAAASEDSVYERFKKEGVIFDLNELLLEA